MSTRKAKRYGDRLPEAKSSSQNCSTSGSCEIGALLCSMMPLKKFHELSLFLINRIRFIVYWSSRWSVSGVKPRRSSTKKRWFHAELLRMSSERSLSTYSSSFSNKLWWYWEDFNIRSMVEFRMNRNSLECQNRPLTMLPGVIILRINIQNRFGQFKFVRWIVEPLDNYSTMVPDLSFE